MKSRFLCMIAFLLIGGTMSAQQYTPNAHNYDNNMPIVATVLLDGVAQTGGELGAFIGNEVRGTATVQALLNNTYWIQVYYHSDTESSETITFKYFDGTDEYDITTTVAVNPEGVGTKTAPQVLEIVTAITQTTALAAGWNWWSTPIEQNGINGLEMLENGMGDNGLYILSQNRNVENYYPSLGYSYWWGDIEELENELGYKLMVSSTCNISFAGRVADPTNHPIQINPGWNWIGYPCGTSQLLANANFVPSDNDVIQSQTDGSTYYDGYGWWPDFPMEPGAGYLYYSTSSQNSQMTFSNPTRGAVKSERRERYWNNDVHAFKDNIVIIANAYLNQEELSDEAMEVGAFVNGENRGSGKLMYFEPLNRYFVLFTISGQRDEVIDFRLVDTRNGIVNSECDTHFSFQPNTVLGNLDNPVELHFGANELVAVNLFPNPLNCNQSFSVDLPSEEKVIEISIVNELGEIVRHEEGSINASSINGLSVRGVYVVKIVCASDKVYYSKLIVK